MENKNKNQISEDEFNKRKKLAANFLNSEFYRLYLEPEIDQKITENNKLNSITLEQPDDKILEEFKKRKYKISIYQGLKLKIKSWAEKKHTKNFRGGN